jgi:hypothetical protein
LSLESDVERGQRAQRLLNDPLLLEARAEVMRVLHETWENAPIRDKDGAHELKLMVKALKDVWALLEQALSDGKLAVHELEEQRKAKLSPAQFNAYRR